jgi:hypothetical protein
LKAQTTLTRIFLSKSEYNHSILKGILHAFQV